MGPALAEFRVLGKSQTFFFLMLIYLVTIAVSTKKERQMAKSINQNQEVWVGSGSQGTFPCGVVH